MSAPRESRAVTAARRLGLIADVSATVIGSAPIAEQMAKACALMKEAFQVDACVVRELIGDDLVLLAAEGPNTDILPPRMYARQGLAAQILSDRQALSVFDVERHPLTQYLHPTALGQAREFTFSVYAGAPMLVSDTVVGIVGIYSNDPERIFSPEDVEHLQMVSNHLGVSIMNSRLFREIERQRAVLLQEVEVRRLAETRARLQLERVTALAAVERTILMSLDLTVTMKVILEQVRSCLDCSAAAIQLYQGDPPRLQMAAASGLPGSDIPRALSAAEQMGAQRAAMTRTAVHIPDLSSATNETMAEALAATGSFQGYFAVPLVARDDVLGVLEIRQAQRLDPDQEWIDFLQALANQAALAIDNASLYDKLRTSYDDIALAYESALEGWSAALELRDRDTQGHTLRVARLAVALARSMRIPEDQLQHIWRGALLHDIGKMGIPDSILHKEGSLTPDEWTVMRKHPEFAFKFLSRTAFLRDALDIPLYHHERWDGQGYPRGLRGEDIPLPARIFSVVDVWDALRSDRPYRVAWSHDDCLHYIRDQAGMLFDPYVVDCFMKLVASGEEERIRRETQSSMPTSEAGAKAVPAAVIGIPPASIA